MNYLLIFIGGGVGSALRYLLTVILRSAPFAPFPMGILLVNVIGCFIMGILAGLGFRNHEVAGPLLTIGLLGGFTTFSTFSIDAITLFSEGKYAQGITYVLVSVFAGIGATVIGLKLT